MPSVHEQEDDMVKVIGVAQARQEMILLRRELELDRLLAVEWPRLMAQMTDYGLRAQVDHCFVRSPAEVQWRVSCQSAGQTRSYVVVLSHPDCMYVLRVGLRETHIISSRNLTQILFDQFYNQTRPGRSVWGADHAPGPQQPA
jgi:hypothetical protein